jgi:protease I
MIQQLAGRKVLVLVSNGVDETAMSMVQRELLKAGAVVKTVGTEPGLVNSWSNNIWGLYFPVDIQISQALGSDFDLLVVPNGTRGIQKLSANPHAERIISSFAAARKPMCFMGEAVELLANIDHANSPVMSGNCTGEIPAFVQKMIVHFAGEQPLPMAA